VALSSEFSPGQRSHVGRGFLSDCSAKSAAWNGVIPASFSTMAKRVEDEPWYQQWHQSLERVIAAQMARDATKLGTPEREAADREYETAMADFRVLANQIR
jgi:hypothetical protein